MADSDEVCSCGHPRAVHEHYRRGSDCGACGARVCAEFRLDTARQGDVAPVVRQPQVETA